MAALRGWHWWATSRLLLRVQDEVVVSHRVVGYGEFERAQEEQASASRGAAVEAERKLVEVSGQVGIVH